MVKIQKLYDYLNGKYPFKKAEEWDFAGFSIGGAERMVEKVLVTLDITNEVIDYAVNNRIEFIITHHPFIFNESKEEDFKSAPYKERLYDRMKNVNITVLSAHTNYDQATDGTSFQLAKKMCIKARSIPGTPFGFFAKLNVDFNDIENLVWEKLKLEATFLAGDKKKKYDNIAFFPGSGSIDDIIKAHKHGVEAVVTSDIKWSDLLTASEMGLAVISVPHSIENVFVEDIYSKLKTKFSNVDVHKLLINSNCKMN